MRPDAYDLDERVFPTQRDYPALADFQAFRFHQDFDIEGETVAEIVQAWVSVS
jgi:hypothetical protein